MKNISLSKKISIICYGVSALIFLAIGITGVFLSAGDEFYMAKLYQSYNII